MINWNVSFFLVFFSSLSINSTQTCSYNDDDGSLKLFLRGRPIVLHAPNDIKDSFDLAKVQPAPNKKLKLDWVYGYRGKDCRSNLYQLPTGEMAYFVAAVVVLYNVDEQSQRHYTAHTDDIKRYFILCWHFSVLHAKQSSQFQLMRSSK